MLEHLGALEWRSWGDEEDIKAKLDAMGNVMPTPCHEARDEALIEWRNMGHAETLKKGEPDSVCALDSVSELNLA